MSFVPGYPQNPERRQSDTDRRENGRGGKYDRRRNRCGNCVAFQFQTTLLGGFCTHLNKALSAESLTCPDFKATS